MRNTDKEPTCYENQIGRFLLLFHAVQWDAINALLTNICSIFQLKGNFFVLVIHILARCLHVLLNQLGEGG